jgi:hypothetical protein
MRTTIRRWLRRPGVFVPLGAVAVLGFLVLLLGPMAYWATAAMDELSGKERADALTATRQILLAAAAGLAALAGLAYTARNYHLSRRGQLTDRFGKAITQLAADKLTERLGGIYALENLMVESERDHDTVVEVLAAFIRERTADPTHDHEGELPDYRSLATDVQAALTVLGRRPIRRERNVVDLRSADLCGADLSGLRLDGVDLWRAKLQHTVAHGVRLAAANLSWAQMQDSRFGSADLTDAFLFGANLQKVTFNRAQLIRAELTRSTLRDGSLRNADLQGANLSAVNLSGVTMTGADLRGVDLVNTDLVNHDLVKTERGPQAPPIGLTAHQLAVAKIDEATVLPLSLQRELVDHYRQRLHRALVVHLEERQL